MENECDHCGAYVPPDEGAVVCGICYEMDCKQKHVKRVLICDDCDYSPEVKSGKDEIDGPSLLDAF